MYPLSSVHVYIYTSRHDVMCVYEASGYHGIGRLWVYDFLCIDLVSCVEWTAFPGPGGSYTGLSDSVVYCFQLRNYF